MHLKHRQKQHLRVSNCQYHPTKYACIMFTKVSHWQWIGKPCSVPVREYCTHCWFLYVKGFECTSPLVSKLLSSTFCCMKIDIDFTVIRPSVRWCDVVTFCTSHLLNKILKRSQFVNRPKQATFINDYKLTDFISWTVFSCFPNIRNRNISIQNYSLLLTHFLLNNVDYFSISTASHQATFLLPHQSSEVSCYFFLL